MAGGDHKQGPFDLMYFLKSALAGGICCGVTHGALTPVDVVKTRIQLEPKVFNKVRFFLFFINHLSLKGLHFLMALC